VRLSVAWPRMGFLIALSYSSSTFAQDRTGDNAVTQAEDAFGFSVGRETIGIYNGNQVRGFSPIAAGNVRIEGLYFDPIFNLNNMLVDSTSIKVGLSAQGYPFLAPSGIVDQTLRRPGDKFGASLIANADSWGGKNVEVDATVPLAATLSLGVGLSGGRTVYPNGTDNSNHNEALILRWRPTDRIEIMPFWSRFDDYNDEAGTFYVPAGDFIPKVDRAHHDESPRWSNNRFHAGNMGVYSSVLLGKNTLAKLGIFRSDFVTKHFYNFLLVDIDAEGVGERLLFSDPPRNNHALSGEARITQSIPDGPRLHNIHLSLRDRDSHRAFGGSFVTDYGLGAVGDRVTEKKVPPVFGEPTTLRTKQLTYGIAYDGRWKNVGELSFGISRADYRKKTTLPDKSVIDARAKPWLYNATLAVVISKSIDAYAGYSKGFEESGTPPPSAANRNEPLSSIITKQKDVGVRVKFGDGMRAVAGLFELSRPYFGFAEGNLFEQVGTVRLRGAEFSVSGKITHDLNLLAGGVIFDPKVTKGANALGEIGSKPSGLPSHILNVNANWAVPYLKGLQLDGGLVHRGRLPATISNSLYLPAQLTVNLGARYGFGLGGHNASLRVQAQNLLDNRAITYGGPSTYGARNSRQVSALFTVDY
jgi:iron complex outermembrane receptor protein